MCIRDSADRLANALIGMKTLYDIKFNVMWDTFGDCVQELEPHAKRPSPLDKAEFDWSTRTTNTNGLSSATPADWDSIR